MSVLTQENLALMYMLVGIDIASIFTIVRLNFGTVLTTYIWNVLVAILLLCIVTFGNSSRRWRS